MFSSPTAIRVLKKQDPAYMKQHDLSALKYLFLAGEPLDEPTARWAADALGVAIVDNYWQTETGWPILSAQPGVEDTPRKFGSPSFPVYGYDVRLLREGSGEEAGADEKAVLTIMPPLPPGCMTTVWGDDARFVQDLFLDLRRQARRTRRSTGRTRDADGYYFVLGRTDDVINVAGHRLGTREIEEAVQAHSRHRRGRGRRRRRFAEGPDAGRLRGREGPVEGRDARKAPRRMREGGDGHRRPRARRDRAAGRGALRHAAAEDPLGQAAAALDPGARRGPRPRRPDDDRGSAARWSRSARP